MLGCFLHFSCSHILLQPIFMEKSMEIWVYSQLYSLLAWEKGWLSWVCLLSTICFLTYTFCCCSLLLSLFLLASYFRNCVNIPHTCVYLKLLIYINMSHISTLSSYPQTYIYICTDTPYGIFINGIINTTNATFWGGAWHSIIDKSFHISTFILLSSCITVCLILGFNKRHLDYFYYFFSCT